MLTKGETVLDVGCGYGPLACLWLRLMEFQATMVDINNRALDLAQQNATKNKVEATIFQSNIYEQVEGSLTMSFRIRLSVQAKQVVHEIIEKALIILKRWRFNHCYPEKQGLQVLRPRWKKTFGNCEIVKKIRDIISLEV